MAPPPLQALSLLVLLRGATAGFRVSGYDGTNCEASTLSWSDSGFTGLSNPVVGYGVECVDFYAQGRSVSFKVDARACDASGKVGLATYDKPGCQTRNQDAGAARGGNETRRHARSSRGGSRCAAAGRDVDLPRR